MVNKSSGDIDVLLEPLLLAASNEQGDALISELLEIHVKPVITGVVSYKLHFNSHLAKDKAEAEDIRQEVTVQLLAELRRFCAQPQTNPIGDLRGLAAVIAHRACARWMRRTFPERHAFKNRLHYLLTRQKGFALWQDENRKLLAGFAAWQGQKRLAHRERIESLSNDERLLGQIRLLQSGKARADSSDIIAAVFNHLGGPVEFDKLISTLAELLNIRDQPLESTDQDESAIASRAAAEETDTAWRVEKRIFLQRLWEEIRELPANQRATLLLNLKDENGRGCIGLFPAAGIATGRQLAEALALSVEEFAELWNELPLDDARIAELLGVTRQQVINARKSARERLTRRLKGFI